MVLVWLNTYKKQCIAAGLALLVICTIGLPYTHWWLRNGDDFHCMFIADKTTTWQQVAEFFIDGKADKGDGASNDVPVSGKSSFFATYYRPIHMIAYTLMYWVFGTNGYAYLLLNVLLHALNAVLLFYLLQLLSSVSTACLGVLLFAYHPQIAYRFGHAAFIQYYLSTLVVLLILILWYHYHRRPSYGRLGLMALLFLMALFIRETAILLPLILLVSSFLCPPIITKNINVYLRATLGPLIIIGSMGLVYLVVRLVLYPLDLATMSSGASFNLLGFLQSKLDGCLVALYDCLWLSWLPVNSKVLRLTITVPLMSFLAWLFIYNKKKLWVLACMLSTLCMLWPICIAYHPRYFYECTPFLLLMYVFLMTQYQGSAHQYYKLLQYFLLVASLFFMFFAISSFKRRETKMYQAQQALVQLLNDPVTRDKPLLFLSYPSDGLGFGYPAEICWVLRQNYTAPIYAESSLALHQQDVTSEPISRWVNVVSTYYDQNYMTIRRVPGGVRYTSDNPEKIVFSTMQSDNGPIGRKIFHTKTTDFTLVIDERYSAVDPVYVYWDYSTKSFRTLEAPEVGNELLIAGSSTKNR